MLGFYQRPHMKHHNGRWWCKSPDAKTYFYNGSTPYAAWWSWVLGTFNDRRDVKLVLNTFR